MNKMTQRHIKYSGGVRYEKYLRFRKASDEYMKDRSSYRFNRLKKLSEDFHKYNRLHMTKFSKFNWNNFK